MRAIPHVLLGLSVLSIVACSNDDSDADVGPFPLTTCADFPDASECFEVDPNNPEDDIIEAANYLTDNAVMVLGRGTFALATQVTIRNAVGVTVAGQGIDVTILDFKGQPVQTNGIDVVGDDFAIRDLTVQDVTKDGVRIEDSDGVTIQRVKATWTTGISSENGAYGIYPVRVKNVLMEDSIASYSSDAGIYVGQCQNAIIRNNLVEFNVAGLEIENTQYADVYGNTATNNTAGLVIFDLPGNPIVGRDIKVHDNIIHDNNTENFAPGGTVAIIPAGTGTFAMASRRVEIYDNDYKNNQTGDIAVISGLVVEGNPQQWALNVGDLVGDIDGLVLDELAEGVIANFRTTEVYVHGNSHEGSGLDPDMSDLNGLGFLLGIAYGGSQVDNVLYGTIGESSFSNTDASANSNDNHICVGASEDTFASLNLEDLAAVPFRDDFFRPPAPFTPFDCDSFTEGPIGEIVLDN